MKDISDDAVELAKKIVGLAQGRYGDVVTAEAELALVTAMGLVYGTVCADSHNAPALGLVFVTAAQAQHKASSEAFAMDAANDLIQRVKA